jgi:hypothetical protein
MNWTVSSFIIPVDAYSGSIFLRAIYLVRETGNVVMGANSAAKLLGGAYLAYYPYKHMTNLVARPAAFKDVYYDEKRLYYDVRNKPYLFKWDEIKEYRILDVTEIDMNPSAIAKNTNDNNICPANKDPANSNSPMNRKNSPLPCRKALFTAPIRSANKAITNIDSPKIRESSPTKISPVDKVPTNIDSPIIRKSNPMNSRKALFMVPYLQ